MRLPSLRPSVPTSGSSLSGLGRATRKSCSPGTRWLVRPGGAATPGNDQRANGSNCVSRGNCGVFIIVSQISNAIYARLQADARARAAGPGGQPGNGTASSAAGSHPARQLFGQATPGPASSLRPDSVDSYHVATCRSRQLSGSPPLREDKQNLARCCVCPAACGEPPNDGCPSKRIRFTLPSPRHGRHEPPLRRKVSICSGRLNSNIAVLSSFGCSRLMG